jgi:cytidine deaminase
VLALNISIEADNKDPIIALALISSNPKAKDMHWYPCGHCRQEFIDHLLYLRKNGLVDSDYDITIICGRPDLTYKTHSLKELLPYSWEPADKGD